MEQNPYAAQSPHGPLASNVPTDVEECRRKYLSHEASVKSIGTFYILGSLLGLFFSTIMLLRGISIVANPPTVVPDVFLLGEILIVFGIIFLCLSIWQFSVALGLKKLTPSSRIGAGVIAGIGLIGFPIGTLISAYFLYLLFSEKGSVVFSEHYKTVIAATPHIVFKTSIIVWILLILLVSLLLIGFLALLFARA
jgi:hypothetical protein